MVLRSGDQPKEKFDVAYSVLPAAALLVLLAVVPSHAGDLSVDGKLVSTVPTGTPPLEVSSTSLVTNLNAELLDGLPSSAFATAVENVVTIGMTGTQFTSIQAALDSITDAGIDNWYVVLVGPGVYHESITLKNYVSVVGYGVRVEAGGFSIGSSGVFGGGKTTAVGVHNAVNTSFGISNTTISANGDGTEALFDAIGDWDDHQAARKVRAPVLVVQGQSDRITPPRGAETWVRLLPDAELLRLPATDHLPLRERPERTAEAIERFLSGSAER